MRRLPLAYYIRCLFSVLFQGFYGLLRFIRPFSFYPYHYNFPLYPQTYLSPPKISFEECLLTHFSALLSLPFPLPLHLISLPNIHIAVPSLSARPHRHPLQNTLLQVHPQYQVRYHINNGRISIGKDIKAEWLSPLLMNFKIILLIVILQKQGIIA